MTMNRVITSVIQIAMVGATVTLIKMMLPMLKEDWKEIKKDLQKIKR